MPENLTDPRTINRACLAAAVGGGTYVYADVGNEKVRIVSSRKRRGRLEVKLLTGESRRWFHPTRVYTD